ncbi:MAG: hypothetical protein JW806_00035 [Sedimentisphaerales bacterium]|nr:hypothetical protein [Sedimentisphaerales bacterium]
MRRTILCVSIILAILLISERANAWPPSDTDIVPSVPTTSDVISITLSGDWPDDCIPNGSSVSVAGNDIYFDVYHYYPPGTICLAIVMPWDETQVVGPLSEGTYNIYAMLNGSETVYMTSFLVTNNQFILSTDSLNIPEGQSNTFTVRLLANPGGTVEVTVANSSGDPDITVQSGALLTFDSSNYFTPQTVTIAAVEDEDYLDGTAVISVSAAGYVTSDVSVTELDNDTPAVLYVDGDANGVNDGTSWSDAFNDLQEALSVAAVYTEVEEIHIAEGVYRPAGAGGNRNTEFQLVYDVDVKGGYAGVGEPDPNVRNISYYETVLSGDLNGDDGPNFTNRGDNSYTVVKGHNMVLLDGCVITGGDGGNGGGIDVSGTNITISNCTIINNRGPYGGGVYSYRGSPTLKNCLLIGNQAKPNSIGSGGGIYCASDNTCYPVLTNCTFVDNSANNTGGGICSFSTCQMTVTDCILWNNSDSGGTDESGQIYATNLTLNYSCIQGLTGALGGVGNIGDDPLFASGPFGDYYLSQIVSGQSSNSPCVDTGSQAAIASGMALLTTRTNETCDRGVVDMGYHYMPSIFSSPDIDKSLSVDNFDLQLLANDWRLGGESLAGDLTRDLYVDFADVLILADAWLDCFVQPASNPEPVNGETYVNPDVVLCWTAGAGASEHDVYLGTDANAVADADHLSAEFMGTAVDANFGPCDLDANTPYYWRIDEVGPRCAAVGDVWSFQTVGEPNLLEGLVAHWMFDEGTGSVAGDSANGHNGTITGATWTTGKIGGALNFDGNNDYVRVPNHSDFDFPAGFSLCAWAQPGVNDVHGRIVYRYDASSQDGYFVSQAQQGSYNLNVYVGGSNSYVASDVEPNAGQWAYIVAVRQSDGDLNIYVDGNIQSEITNASGEIDSSGDIFIGVDLGLNWDFTGKIDDIRIYNRPLTGLEIGLLYDEGMSP